MQNRIKCNFLYFHWILNFQACPCMALWSFEITCLDQCADINNVGHMIPVTDYSSWSRWCGSDVAAARVWRSVFGPDPCVSCGQRGKTLCCGPSARGHTEPTFCSPFPFLTHRGNTLGFVYASGASTVQKCENGREEEGDENLSSTFHDDLEVFTNFTKKGWHLSPSRWLFGAACS